MSDLEGAIRHRKAAKHVEQLALRPSADLIGVGDLDPAGRLTVLVDTNVYIREAAGTMPVEVETLLDRALLFHCSVCIAELAIGIGNKDPARPQWAQDRDHYKDLIAAIPAARLLVPDAGIWTEAGLIAGMLSRTQRFQPYQRKECLNDALIYLTAAKMGLPVLTSNRDDFDLIGQLVPKAASFTTEAAVLAATFVGDPINDGAVDPRSTRSARDGYGFTSAFAASSRASATICLNCGRSSGLAVMNGPIR